MPDDAKAPAGDPQSGGRREQLLDAAAVCFARGGFHATTIAEISLEAQCSPGLLYRYFAGQEALVSALVEREGGRTVAALSAARGPDLVAGLDRAAATSATGWEDPQLAALHIQIVAEAARGSQVTESVRRHFHDIIEALAGTLKAGQESGVVDHQLDPGDTARTLVALASGLTLLRAVEAERGAPKADLDGTAHLLQRLLQPQTPAAAPEETR